MLTVGQEASLTGDVTRLNWIAGKSPAAVERALGYGAGRLDAGYWLAVLKERLRANHVRFAGLTLRSGGREGAPRADPELDRKRVHTHDRVLEQYSAGAVHTMLAKLAADPRNLTGTERIVKIIPVTRHRGDNPAVEYPMGEGGPQFTLVEGHSL
jgi:hypothetical protein